MTRLVSEEKTWEIADRRAKKIEQHMSPPGQLKGINPVLEERRLKYGIPDEAFKVQACFKRIYVWQVQPWDGETYGPDSQIIKLDTTKQRGKESTPRGIIVSAGMESLDALLSHGMAVGDLVWIVAMGVYRLPVLEIDARDEVLLVLQVGDVTGGEDTWERIQSGELTVNYDDEARQHYYDWRGKSIPRPISPFVPDL